jgi:hypothetical protein
MKSNPKLLRVTLLITAAALLGLTGCGLPDARLTASASPSDPARTVMPRAHREMIDTDGLFVTYWERYYDRGGALMTTGNRSYGMLAIYSNVVTSGDEKNPCIVVGKGTHYCWGQNFSWNTVSKDVDYFGVYGWLYNPLVEYYIGRGGGDSKGTYTTSRGTYTLYVKHLDQENIKYPEGHSPFDQYNCDGPGTSPINMAEHYAAWEKLMGIKILSPYYCVVASEVWSKRNGGAGINSLEVGENNIISYPSIFFAPRSRYSNPIKIASTKTWKLVSASKPRWVTVSPSKGSLLVTDVTVQVARNRTGSYRIATLKFCLTSNTSTVATLQIYQE